MKTDVTIPEPVFHQAEALAAKLGLSVNELYERALSEYIAVHDEEQITKQLNDIYATQPSSLDPVLQNMQTNTLPTEEW